MPRYPSGHVALERALSKLGLASRKRAQELVRDGRVTVNGKIATDPLAPVRPEKDTIRVAGRLPAPRVWRAIAFHKPRGTVTTRRDPEGRQTVFDVLGDAADGLIAVGRLDWATAGLLILTTDAQLAERLTNPRHAVVRRYVVTVRGEVSDDAAKTLESGIGDLRASRVVVRKRSRRETHLIVELTEGKNREIRRLFDGLGHPVTRLLRVAYGPIELGALQPGQWRELAPSDLAPP
jgi:23S rRNA pseudouridine2605 synthase